MHKQNDQLHGWEIENSADSEEENIRQITQTSKVTKTQPSDRLCFKKLFLKSPQLSPIRIAQPSIHQTTPLRDSIKHKFISVNSLIRKQQTICDKQQPIQELEIEQNQSNQNQSIINQINVAHLRIKLNAIPKQQPKAYTQNQLQAMMQLKRKNLYLKSVLKKVSNESDERYSNHQKQQEIFLGYRYLDDLEQIHKFQSPSNSVNKSHSRKNSNRRPVKVKLQF